MKGWVRASKFCSGIILMRYELNRGERAFWGFKGSNIGAFAKIRNEMQFREVSKAKINFQNEQLHGIQKLFNLARYIGNCETKTCLCLIMGSRARIFLALPIPTCMQLEASHVKKNRTSLCP